MRRIIVATLVALTAYSSSAAAFDPPPAPALEPVVSPASAAEPPELAFIAALPVVLKGITEADGPKFYSYFEFHLQTRKGQPDRLYIVLYDSRERKHVRGVWTLQMVGEELLWWNLDR